MHITSDKNNNFYINYEKIHNIDKASSIVFIKPVLKI